MNDIGNNLKRIRLLKNLSLRESGKLLNMSATAIAKYESGKIIPNSTKIIEFAKAYNVKAIELLKVNKEINMTFTSFRKKRTLNGERLDLLKSLIKNEVSNYFEILKLDNHDTSVNFLPTYSYKNILDIQNAAIEFRKLISLSSTQPLYNIINTLESTGIIIIFIRNENNMFSDFDGLSEIVNNVPVIVLLDSQKDGARQRFTIAHELGHLLLVNNSNDINIEKACNVFASSLLIPKDALIERFGKKRRNISYYELYAFRNDYEVSYKDIIYRLKELKIITNYIFKQLNNFISNYIGIENCNLIKNEHSFQYKRIVHKLE